MFFTHDNLTFNFSSDDKASNFVVAVGSQADADAGSPADTGFLFLGFLDLFRSGFFVSGLKVTDFLSLDSSWNELFLCGKVIGDFFEIFCLAIHL